MKKKEIPLCPKCQNQMAVVWYHEMEDLIEQFVKERKVFYRGIELKEDRNNPNQIKYHCYNCNRSYSKNLEKFVIETDCIEYVEQAKQILQNTVDELSDEVIKELSDEDKQELKSKPEYSHFGIGLYIRNNFIYGNDKLAYRFEADSLSKKIYDRILEKI